jgi:endoglucanase
MSMSTLRRRALVTAALVAAGVAVSVTPAAPALATDRTLPASTHFYVDDFSEHKAQSLAYLLALNIPDSVTMGKLASWPWAQWFNGDATPSQVQADVSALMLTATLNLQVPVLAAYNVPGRDCSQYSSGGASNTEEYEDWIDGFAAGIGNTKAVVILEPDGVALSPDQCGGTAEQQQARNTELTYAVDRLQEQPHAIVYVDAGHSSWHSVGDISERLLAAGLANAQGFSLNVSNYRTTAELVPYGTMVSKCVWYLQNVPGAAGDDCPNQFWSTPDADAWFTANVPANASLTHFVLDTSRNGQGPWTPPPNTYSDPQDWCNPPGRGVGPRPTANTGVALLDAYLWIKVPGESDGSCTRGTAGPGDPEYGGEVGPAAGVFWPDQALSLAELANPALTYNPWP